jgi:hypothetical protein
MATEKSPVALAAPRALENDRSSKLVNAHNSPSSSEPQYPEKRRLDRAQYLSFAEIEARYGVRLETLQGLKPSFPQAIRVAGNSEPFFSRSSVVCWELALKRHKSQRGRAS